MERAKEPWAGAWCAPGGFCDAGEHPIETVEREALEETGLRVAVTGYIGVWVDEYADAEAAPSVDVINVAYYTAVTLGGPEGPVDEAEVRAVRWFARDEPRGRSLLPARWPRSSPPRACRCRSATTLRPVARPRVDGFAGLIELAARQPLVAGRVEVPRRLQVPVGRAHVPPDVELEDPERVPGLRVLRLELDGLRVPLLGRARESLALGDVRERQHRRRRVWVERTGVERARERVPEVVLVQRAVRLPETSLGESRRRERHEQRAGEKRCDDGQKRATATAPGGRPAPTSTPRAKSVGAVTARKSQL